MKRRLLNLLTLLSLLLMVVMAMLWVRSGWTADFVTLTTHTSVGGFAQYGLDSVHGSVHIGWMRSLSSPPQYGLEWTTEKVVRVLNDHWGFGFEHQPPSNTTSVAFWELWFPDWLLMLAAGILPAVWLFRARSQRRRLKEGLCLKCGYDLRASKDRCPECGTPVSATPGSPRDTSNSV